MISFDKGFPGFNEARMATYRRLAEEFQELPIKPTFFVEGRLYKCKHPLLVYPLAAFAAKAFHFENSGNAKGSSKYIRQGAPNTPAVEIATAYWSARLGCTVRCTNAEDVFLYLHGKILRKSSNGTISHVLLFLFPEFSGWVAYTEECKIERVE